MATLERLSLDEEKTPSEELAKMFHLEDEYHDYKKGRKFPWYKRAKPIIWQMFNEPYSSKTAKLINKLANFLFCLI